MALAPLPAQLLGTFTAPYRPMASADDAEILRRLSRGVVSTGQESRHVDDDHVAAVFADRASAHAAVDALRTLGLGSEHLGMAVHRSDSVVQQHGWLRVHGAQWGLAPGQAE